MGCLGAQMGREGDKKEGGGENRQTNKRHRKKTPLQVRQSEAEATRRTDRRSEHGPCTWNGALMQTWEEAIHDAGASSRSEVSRNPETVQRSNTSVHGGVSPTHDCNISPHLSTTVHICPQLKRQRPEKLHQCYSETCRL